MRKPILKAAIGLALAAAVIIATVTTTEAQWLKLPTPGIPRQIFTDGRTLPKDPEPAWFGYSVGRWEGATLVVDTIGIHEKTWLDDSGHPHSDALHIIERFRRTDFGHMDVQITIDDPKAYAKPWTVSFGWELMPDTELLDWVCENNKYFELVPK